MLSWNLTDESLSHQQKQKSGRDIIVVGIWIEVNEWHSLKHDKPSAAIPLGREMTLSITHSEKQKSKIKVTWMEELLTSMSIIFQNLTNQ
jgi:hypothetical protein